LKAVRWIVWVAIFVALLFSGWRFAHQNDATVSIDFVVGQTGELALWEALLLAVAVGVLATGVVLGWALLRARLESRRYRKAVANLESEVHQLRNLPVLASGASSPVESEAVPELDRGAVPGS